MKTASFFETSGTDYHATPPHVPERNPQSHSCKNHKNSQILARCVLYIDNVSIWAKQRLLQMNECKQGALVER
jgi:hypothetical protein